MASINSYEFLRIVGYLDRATGQRLERDERFGLDGVEFRRRGRLASPTIVRTISGAEDADEALELLNNFKALQGGLVTFVDEMGWTEQNVAVLNVRPAHAHAIGVASDGSGVLLHCEWELEATVTA